MFEHLKNVIVEHAESTFPNECLGVVVDGEYVRLENVDPEPEKFFAMSEDDELKYIVGGKAQAIVHSHPVGPLYPSETDMRVQMATTLPFVIVGHDQAIGWDLFELGDHTLDIPLVGRSFRPGVTDCYDLIRAWYWQERGILLDNIPRRESWWLPLKDDSGAVVSPPQNLYADFFGSQGFVELPDGSQLQEGDVFLYRLHPGGADVAARTVETHGGVYLGEGSILHHLPGRLSARDDGEGWGRKASRWLRREG